MACARFAIKDNEKQTIESGRENLEKKTLEALRKEVEDELDGRLTSGKGLIK